MFSSPAYAQAAGAPAGPGIIEGFLPLILIFAVFYLLILRPQNKKNKERKEMLSNVKRGDVVVTGGGLIGKVTKVKDDSEVEVDLGEGVRVRALIQTLADVRVKGEPVKMDTKKEAKK